MLNKLSYNLMNALNESEEIKVKKITYTANTYLNENCKEEKLDENIETSEEKDAIEERLASLKTQLEVDGEQLADDEKEAIKAEIAELENQLAEDEVDDKIMNESAPGTDAYDKLVQGDDVYFRNEEGVALLGHYADNYPEPEEYDEGFKPEYGGTEEGLQKAKEAANNKDVWEFMEVFEDTLQPMNEVYAYVYGQDDLMEMLKTLRQVNVVKKLEENQIEDARKDSIEKGLLSEAVFEIDYAPDGEDLSTENAVIDSVNKWLDPISDAVEVTVVELNGPSGWPVVRLSGNKEEIADFLYSNYNSGEDSLEDIIKLHLVNEAEEIDTEFKVGDVVKVPYKYGSYTPGEFTDAPIIDISEGRYVTVEIPSKLEVTMDQLKKWNTLGECDESLKESYSDKLGGDPADFVTDVETIKAKLSEIDTSGFGSHLAAQMVEDWIETCDYQIEKGKRLASGNEFYTESKKSKKIKHALKESEYYYNSDYDERLKYLIADIRDIKGFANLLISEFGESEPEEDDYNYEEGCHVVNVGGTTFYINKDLDDIWCYDDDPEFTMEELCNNANIYTFLEKEGLVSDHNEYEDEDDYDDYDEDDLDEADDRTYKDKDEAEYYRNKELYANSGLERHREAMMAAKKACEEKGIKLDESDLPKLKMKPRNDDRKNHKKIDIYVDGKYFCSTTAHKTVKDAVASVKSEYPELEGRKVKGNLAESEKAKPIAEAEVKGLKEVKNQGNVYMLEDETNKFIVGENYNADEGLIENAEIYDSKEEADKDYLGRCEITGGQKEIKESVKERDLSKDIFGDEANKRASNDQRAYEKYLALAKEVKDGKNDTITLDSAKQLLKNAYVKAKGYYSFEPEEIDRRIAKDIPELFSVSEN